MTNSSLSRKRSRASRVAVLALGPWCGLLGCNVYGDAPPDAGPTDAGSGGLGGSSSNGQSGEGAQPQQGGSTTVSGQAGGGSDSGGEGGSAGSAGNAAAGTPSAGSAGTAAGGAPPVTDPDAIDDMEDNDPQIAAAAGRNGYWYVGNDGTATGTQEPIVDAFEMFALEAGERPSGTFSAHMKVNGFTGWGSVLGFNFFEQLGVVKTYDASDYCGVSFWAKAAAATSLRFRVPDSDTHPAGAVCVDGGPAGQACYDHFSGPAAFTTTWKQFTFMFSELTQVGTGYHPVDMKLKADQLFGLEWALPGAGKAYEIWIDDVAFLKCL